MNQEQVVCDRGHYYSKSLGECPICKNNSTGTVLLDIGNSQEPKKREVPKRREDPEAIKKIKESKEISTSKTQYISTSEEDKKDDDNDIVDEAVVLAGWLVITSSKGKGRSYPITFGFNSIGRGDSNHINITNQDNSISRDKHAIIIYDYSNNLYFLKHEDGKFLTYLNNNVVMETKKLESFDMIKIGNTEFLFVALCNDKFKWDV